ncbi:uncharacterized protein E0L32_008705 [Thyridium curvatum]|uniref:Fatty acid desaturase domain-containing protein n=1 Tax=Thyridium curvatum TaxID=1093900 RepID=A0A507B174_9PEZI|nr:uncharacterized protein E0L32_008705 [Thyridium curvatum]TPX10300.1 hypothetical protein E0L32_008705 [Thyridium curvatum]
MSQTTMTVTARKPEKKNAEASFPDVNTIRNAIPAHCFKPSTLRSLSYVARDITLAVALGWLALTYIPQLPTTLYRTIAWIVYGFCQGCVGTGIWILAHEAGHGAFSAHQTLNDVVGWTLHSALLVPYFSWKFSHHRHHRFTGNMEKDMAFVPATRPNTPKRGFSTLYLDPEWLEDFEDAPVIQLLRLLVHQLGGWPAYLLFNVSAGSDSRQWEGSSWFRNSHFDPYSAVFRPNEAGYIVLSDIGLAITAACLYMASTVLGGSTVFLLYGVPYLWVHHWLVAITYLHHTHPELPHYEAESWTFVKGALATVDRDFGFIGRHMFHGIIETHVVHHLFPRIPFYYADEATEAVKPLLGDLYHRDDRSFMSQLWTTFNECKFVEKNPKVPGALKWAD